MNANLAEGLFTTPSANGTGPVVYVPAAAHLMVAPADSLEQVAITQIAPDGTTSLKYGPLVAQGSGLATYPAPDADNFMLAKMFTPAAPLSGGRISLSIPATTAVADTNINPLVISSEFGGR